ncbi:MAG: BatD family protein [Xanthobacteraceae bacterium]
MKSLTTKSLAASTALVLVLASFGLALADVRASLSQNRVALGDSFSLRLEASGQPEGSAPDLAPLAKDFKVEGSSQTSTTHVINGAVTRSHGWTVTLSPKAVGNLAIPPITVGSESSRPMSIAVVDGATLPRANLTSSGLQVDMTVPDGTYYVQQEIPVTVRVMATAGLRDIALSEPAASDVIVKQTGEDKSHTETIAGRPVSVIERTYLVTPQKSGELVLPPVVLRGYADDPDAGRSIFGDDDPFDIFRKQFRSSGFASSLFDRMTNPGREITARSKPLTLKIQARPGQQQASWFLPAKNVELVSQWQPADPVFKVGEASARIVQVVALGAAKEQLPDLHFNDVDGARIYVDRVDDRSVDTGQGTAAVKQYTLSIVPTRAGAVTLPGAEVHWLDAATGEQKTARLSAETIQVGGAATAGASQALPPATTPAKVAASSAPVAGAAGEGSDQIAILLGSLIALMLAALLAFWWRSRRKPDSSRPRDAVAPGEVAAAAFAANAQKSAERQEGAAAAFRQACRRSDAGEAISSLQRWSAASGVNLLTLTSPAAQEFKAALQNLEACLYRDTNSDRWNGRTLLKAFDAVRMEACTPSCHTAPTGNLPPLYAGHQTVKRAA